MVVELRRPSLRSPPEAGSLREITRLSNNLARSSYKGYFFDRRVTHLITERTFTGKQPRNASLPRRATIPNSLSYTLVETTGAQKSRSYFVWPIFTTRPVGSLSFTRKPFTYPYKKRRRIK